MEKYMGENNMDEKIIVEVIVRNQGIQEDIEIPTNITARELLVGLNEIYKLNIDTNDITNCYLKVENPIAFIKGNKCIGEYGLRNGSVINL